MLTYLAISTVRISNNFKVKLREVLLKDRYFKKIYEAVTKQAAGSDTTDNREKTTYYLFRIRDRLLYFKDNDRERLYVPETIISNLL